MKNLNPLVLSVPQGTPPLFVDSTTKVNNLNVDQLDGFHSTDFAGAEHAHGNITSAGAIGSTAGLIIKTGTSGALTALAAGSSGQFLGYDGTWATPPDTIYTHPSYTAQASGLYKIAVDALGHVSAVLAVSKSDITALGIPAQDTVYTLPVATVSTLGGIKSGTDITVDASGNVSVNDDSHNHIIGNIDGLQTALDGKVDDSQVLTNVPADAVFTDTVYTHPTSGVGAGTYRSVTVNTLGHVTGGTNPTTLSGYGITDAVPLAGGVTLTGNLVAVTNTSYTTGMVRNIVLQTGTPTVSASNNGWLYGIYV